MIQEDENGTIICDCVKETCTIKTHIGFINSTNDDNEFFLLIYTPSSIEFDKRALGFFGSCIPLEAVMMANFHCLYNETCLKLLLLYFPRLTVVINIFYE